MNGQISDEVVTRQLLMEAVDGIVEVIETSRSVGVF
jgi:hypothetical protein